MATVLSTVLYFNVESSLEIWSLTLDPNGADKCIMSRHAPPFLGPLLDRSTGGLGEGESHMVQPYDQDRTPAVDLFQRRLDERKRREDWVSLGEAWGQKNQ